MYVYFVSYYGEPARVSGGGMFQGFNHATVEFKAKITTEEQIVDLESRIKAAMRKRIKPELRDIVTVAEPKVIFFQLFGRKKAKKGARHDAA